MADRRVLGQQLAVPSGIRATCPWTKASDASSSLVGARVFSLKAPCYELIRVAVDGVVVDNATLDRDAGTVTFDRAPSTNAVVEITYVVDSDTEVADE